jgi:two-component system, NtrC family, response regulator HydG
MNVLRRSPALGEQRPRIVPRRPVAETQPFPEMDDLRERLRFCPNGGRIWLDDVRMALLHVPALAGLRRELIDSLGIDAARGLLTRVGYASGSADAALARKVRGQENLLDAFSVGPQLHALEGIVHVEPVRVEVEPERGHYFGEFLWRDSIEVDCHVSVYGVAPAPTCWMQIGYACGYTTVFMGRPILYREVECRSTGAATCRIVGKPVEDWYDAREDLRFLRSEAFSGAAASHEPAWRRPGPELRLPDGLDVASPEELVGASSSFNAACHSLSKVAGTKATVLFLGETGVGKEMFARTLHRIGKRANGPFVALNCAAIPENLAEAELFGVEKGAYTGAIASRPGRFERASGGTLFLDEIGSLSLAAQGKLLRALQIGEIERVGDVQTRRVDVRVVAATNEDLEEQVAVGTFRADLYYRLNVFPIVLPPLRERRDDVPLLVRHFLTRFTTLYEKNVPGLTERAIAALLDYDYPGNVRELEHMIERAVILANEDAPLDVALLFNASQTRMASSYGLGDDGTLRPREDPCEPRSPLESIATDAISNRVSLKHLDRTIMEKAVALANGNLALAARSIGLTRPQLAYRLKKSY